MIAVKRQYVTTALEHASRVTSAKSPQPQMQHIAISLNDGNLVYKAMDARLTLVGSIEATGDNAAFTANARELLSVVQAIDGDTINFSPKKDHIAVSGVGKRSFKVRTLSYADYPETRPVPTEFMELPLAVTEAMARVECSVADERDERESLRSIHVVSNGSKLTATTTDNRRVSRCTVEGEFGNFDVCVPIAAAKILLESKAGFGIAAPMGTLWFRIGGIALECRTYASEFPAMEGAFVLAPPQTVELESAPLANIINAVKRADREGDIICTLTGTDLRIESLGDGYAVDEMPCVSLEGMFGLSARAVLDALKAAGPKVELSYESGNPLSPIVIKAPAWIGVLMPIQIDVIRQRAKL